MVKKAKRTSRKNKGEDIMSEYQIQKAFEIMGLGTQEKREEILSKGIIPNYGQTKRVSYEVWTSPYTFERLNADVIQS